MAREIQVLTWCDLCQHIDDIKTEGEELPPVSIGNAKPRVLAMCKQHRTDFWEPFQDALKELGVLADQLNPIAPRAQGGGGQPTVSSARIQCPLCPTKTKNRGTLASHLRGMHNSTLAEAFEGEPIYDLDGVEIEPGRVFTEPEIKSVTCEVEGCDDGTGQPVHYEWPKHQRPRSALGVHMRMKHDTTLAEMVDA